MHACCLNTVQISDVAHANIEQLREENDRLTKQLREAENAAISKAVRVYY